MPTNDPKLKEQLKDQPRQPADDGKPKEPTPDEKKVLEDFAGRFLGEPAGKADDKADKGKAKDKKPDDERQPKGDDDGTPPDDKATKPKPKPPVKEPRQPPPSYENLVAAAAEGAARALKPDDPKLGDDKPADQPDGLPEREQKKIKVLQHMETLGGDKYKGIAKKYQDSLTSAMAYADKWEQEHPGEQFDEDDPQHSAFFDKQNVDWDDDDYHEAMIDLRAEEKAAMFAEKVSSSTREEIAEIKRQDKLRQSAREIDEQQVKTSKEYFSLFDEEELKEVGAIIDDKGQINRDAITQLEKTDPIAAEIVVQHFAGNVLEPLAGEVTKLYRGLVKYDPENQAHTWLNQFVSKQEEAMLSQPAQERLNEQGKSFVTAAEWLKLSGEDKKRHWTFQEQDVNTLLAHEIKRQAIENYRSEKQRFEKWHSARNPDAAPQKDDDVPHGTNKPDEDEDDEQRGKPTSPSAQAAPKMARSGNKPPGSRSEVLSALAKRFLGET